MLLIYPFSTLDQDLALKNAQWMVELGNYAEHDILVISDKRCDPDIIEAVVKTFTGVFRFVKHRMTKTDVDGWPQGANHMFAMATSLIQFEKNWPYFLWLEPDAIPLTAGWVDMLEAEYKRAGRTFMGDRVEFNDVPLHMSGVGIYQNPIYLAAGEAYRAHDTAWDIAAKDQIVPKAYFTKLIQHVWKRPRFVTYNDLASIRPEAVLFHSSKDGSLIDLWRAKKAAPTLNNNSVETEPTSGSPSREEIGTLPVQPIRKLPSGIWVLEGDTVISEQIAQHGRLDFDPILPHILAHIRPGDTVVDAGAFVGDHTVAYSNAVGPKGIVYAYEPNPLAFECLRHNTKGLGNVYSFNFALGDTAGEMCLVREFSHASGYIAKNSEHTYMANVPVKPMDGAAFGKIDLIKLDVEGYELNVLKGAEKIINKFHPKLVIEINEPALKRQGVTPDNITNWVCAHGYSVSVLYHHEGDVPFYDIICIPLPAATPPETSSTAPAHTTHQDVSAAPVVPTVRQEVEWHVSVLQHIAESDPQNKAIVMQKLVYAGLKQPKPNKKKKHAPIRKAKSPPPQEECGTVAEEYTA